VICCILSGFPEGTYFEAPGAQAMHDAMYSFKAVDVTNPLTLIYGVIIGLKDFFVAVFCFLTWDFSMFTGYWAIFRWLLTAISVGVVTSILLALRGVSSV